MKIKADFVTNSSSSSFVVIGVTIDSFELTSFINEGCLRQLSEICKKEITIQDVENDIYLIDELLKNTSLQTQRAVDDDHIMIGIPYTKMDDDETLGQLKARVEHEIEQVFGVEVKSHHIEACWENR